MSKQSKIVDLVVSKDGSYSPKNSKSKSVAKHKYTDSNASKPKYVQSREVDEFLAGMDAGLNLLDEVIPRVKRFLGLRNM